jgi:hypothetical protein
MIQHIWLWVRVLHLLSEVLFSDSDLLDLLISSSLMISSTSFTFKYKDIILSDSFATSFSFMRLHAL